MVRDIPRLYLYGYNLMTEAKTTSHLGNNSFYHGGKTDYITKLVDAIRNGEKININSSFIAGSDAQQQLFVTLENTTEPFTQYGQYKNAYLELLKYLDAVQGVSSEEMKRLAEELKDKLGSNTSEYVFITTEDPDEVEFQGSKTGVAAPEKHDFGSRRYVVRFRNISKGITAGGENVSTEVQEQTTVDIVNDLSTLEPQDDLMNTVQEGCAKIFNTLVDSALNIQDISDVDQYVHSNKYASKIFDIMRKHIVTNYPPEMLKHKKADVLLWLRSYTLQMPLLVGIINDYMINDGISRECNLDSVPCGGTVSDFVVVRSQQGQNADDPMTIFSNAAKKAGGFVQKDAWNPADVWIVRKGFDCNTVVRGITGKTSGDRVKSLGKRLIDNRCNVLGISLKKLNKRVNVHLNNFSLTANAIAPKRNSVCRVVSNMNMNAKNTGFASHKVSVYFTTKDGVTVEGGFRMSRGGDTGSLCLEYREGDASAQAGKTPVNLWRVSGGSSYSLDGLDDELSEIREYKYIKETKGKTYDPDKTSKESACEFVAKQLNETVNYIVDNYSKFVGTNDNVDLDICTHRVKIDVSENHNIVYDGVEIDVLKATAKLISMYILKHILEKVAEDDILDEDVLREYSCDAYMGAKKIGSMFGPHILISEN